MKGRSHLWLILWSVQRNKWKSLWLICNWLVSMKWQKLHQRQYCERWPERSWWTLLMLLLVLFVLYRIERYWLPMRRRSVDWTVESHHIQRIWNLWTRHRLRLIIRLSCKWCLIVWYYCMEWPLLERRKYTSISFRKPSMNINRCYTSCLRLP